MNNLSIFPAPNEGEVTLCEIDGRIHSMNYEYANISAFTTSVDNHPKIHITADMLHPYSRGDEARSLFVPVNEPFLKRVFQAYSERGAIEVLNTAEEFGSVIISKLASAVLSILNGLKTVRSKLTSTSLESNITLISNISRTRFWLQSSIRCIAWHDYHIKVAVATSDDVVRIYCSNSTVIPLLKCKQQQNITCLAWRPLSNSEIAVGCENGVFVWNIDHSPVITRPSINNATILYRVNHVPVVSIAWNTGGDLLATAAATDSVVLIWNVEMKQTSSLKIQGARGNCLLKWSPNGKKLFSATSGLIFRVWECQTWKSECWNVLTGRIQASCWSPCGSILLFVTNTEPIIYALSFVQSELFFANSSENSANLATPVYDLSKGDIDGVVVGGVVQNMEWDPMRNHVAVLFRDTNYVAVFKIALKSIVKLNPCCLVAGALEEKPTCIAFQENFQHGACLSIGWSTGRVQHFPIIYSAISTATNISQELLNANSFYSSFNSFKTP